TFEAGTGATEYDKSGNSNTGTWGGTGTHYAGGKVGSYAGQFNGSDDILSCGSSTSLRPTNTVTVTAWINGSFSSKGAVSYHYNVGDSSYGIREGTVQVYTSSSNTVSMTSGSGWYFYAMTYDGSTLTGYKNGASIGSTAASGNITYNYGMCIGAQHCVSGGYHFFSGYIDDVRVYTRALSAAEISAIYNATK
ncbi:MAG: LamG domain-containing protein, partial [Candidatus Pacebacteria bacterium]|nr:LamG domain-containing protein [Candidatus Paceibacterota bacterium]